MSKVQESSEFYGLDLTDFAAVPIKGTVLSETDKAKYTPSSSHLLSYALQHSQTIPSVKNGKKTEKKNKLDKRKLNKHKILSPEEIMMKCARQAYERELAASIELSGKPPKKVSPFIERKKKNQQRRRFERSVLIKAYKHQLAIAYGKLVFQKRWWISRAELISTLNLVPENIDYEKLYWSVYNRWREQPVRTVPSIYTMVTFFKPNYMLEDESEYDRKMAKREREKKRKVECEIYKRKNRKAMRRERLYQAPREKEATIVLTKKAKASISEFNQLKRQELDDCQDINDPIDNSVPQPTQ